MAKWFNIYNPNDIADRIDKAKSIDKNGKVSFKGFEHYDCTIVCFAVSPAGDAVVGLGEQIGP